MLKIKDSVDLKELEKFRFVYNKETGVYIYRYFVNIVKIHDLTVNSWNGVISCSSREDLIIQRCDKGMMKLFDLIQAGLVEKVKK